MDDTNIEIFEDESINNDNTTIALPVNFVPVGTVDKDSVQVYIKQDVYKRIEKYAKEDTSKEVGSILIGECVDDNDKKTVIISSYIEAKYTDASASTLTFTHETWDYVHKEKDKKYSGKKIVGWQHTHPGYGIFLSNYDIFIQENFFDLPWQIAYVVDPVADTRGFFEWKNSKVTKMTGFYVYDEIGREIKISKNQKPKKKNISPISAILSFAVIIASLTAIGFKTEINSMSQKIRQLETLQSDNILKTDTDINVKSEDLHKEDDNIVKYKKYDVKNGDTLEKICKINDIDYAENLAEILYRNSISNPDNIYVGQILILPY